MASYEYIGVRAVLAGMSQFKSDISAYNSMLDSVSKATASLGDETVASAKASAEAYVRQAAAAADTATAQITAMAKISESYSGQVAALKEVTAAQEQNAQNVRDITAATLEQQGKAADAIVGFYYEEAKAAVASADKQMIAAQEVAVAMRAEADAALLRAGTVGGAVAGPGNTAGLQAAANEAEVAAAKAKLAADSIYESQTRIYQAVAASANGVKAQWAEEGAAAIASADEQVLAARSVEVANLHMAQITAQATATMIGAAAEESAAADRVIAAKQAFAGVLAAGQQGIQLFAAATRSAVTTTLDFGKALLLVSAAGGVALGAALVVGTKSAMDLESSLANVQAVSQANNADITQLGQTYLNLGRSVGVPLSSIQTIGLDMARAGVSVADLNAGLVKQVSNLSQASGGELDYSQAANFAAVSMHQFGVNAKEAGDIIDATAAIAAQTTLTFSDITDGMKQAAAVAHSYGLTWQQTLAIIADAGQVLGSGVQAGTNLTQMLVRLHAPTELAMEVMNRDKVAVYGANGAHLDFAKTLTSLQAKYSDAAVAAGKLTAQQRDEALSAIFNTRSLREVLILVNQGTDAYNAFGKAIANSAGFAQQAADKVNNTLVAQLQILKNNLQANSIELVNTFIPGLKDFVKTLNTSLAGEGVIKGIQTLGLAISTLARGGDLATVIREIQTLSGGGGGGVAFTAIVISLQRFGDELSVIGTKVQTFLEALNRATGGSGQAANAIDTARNAVLGFEHGIEGVLDKATAFVDNLKNMGLNSDNLRQIMETVTKIGLVGMAAALVSIAGPFLVLGARVTALATALTALHKLYQEHPGLVTAAAAALGILAAAFALAENRAKIMVDVKTAQWIIQTGAAAIATAPELLLVVAGIVAIGAAAEAMTKPLDGLKNSQDKLATANAALTDAQRAQRNGQQVSEEAMAHYKQNVDDAQAAVDKAAVSTKDDSGIVTRAIKAISDQAGQSAASFIANMNAMGVGVATLANNADNAAARVVRDLQEMALAQQGILDLQDTSRVQRDNADAASEAVRLAAARFQDGETAAADYARAQDKLRAAEAAQAAGAAAGVGPNSRLADEFKKGKNEADKAAQEIKTETDILLRSGQQAGQYAEQFANAMEQAKMALADATVNAETNYQKQLDAAKRSYTDQRAEAQRAFDEQSADAKANFAIAEADRQNAYSQQRADAKLAYTQQEADRLAAYQLQRADAAAAFAQQQADQAANRAFDEQQKKQAQLFNEAEKLKTVALQNSFTIGKENASYQDKLAKAQMDLDLKLAVAKNANQKKALQTQFDLQKANLDLAHKQALEDIDKQIADAKAQADLQNQITAETDAFQATQDAARLAFQDAQQKVQYDRQVAQAKAAFDLQTKAAQESFDRQEAAAKQAFDRQELAAKQALEREEKARQQAFEREKSRQDDSLKRAKDNAAEAKEAAIKAATEQYDKILAAAEQHMATQLTDLANTTNREIADIGNISTSLAQAQNQLTEVMNKDIVLLGNNAYQSAKILAQVLGRPAPTPPSFTDFQAPPINIRDFTVHDTGGRAGNPWGSHVPALLDRSETVMTPTQISNLVSNVATTAINRSTTINNQFDVNANYAQAQMVGSLTLDIAGLLGAASR